MDEHPGRDLVVIAASAGGIEPLRTLLGRLPSRLQAALLVVVHISPRGGSALSGILNRSGPLPCSAARDGEPLQPGRVYVARPDHHLLVHRQTARLSRGPRHNGMRPAADPLFLSAAIDAGPRTIGVVLSGTLDDGATGSAAIERYGGAVAVQDPDESAFSGMPSAALAATTGAQVLPAAKIADWIVTHSRSPVVTHEPRRDPELEREIALLLRQEAIGTPVGNLTAFTCPECSGPIYEGPPERYECRVGHAWSAQSMIESQGESVERALWMAILRLEERARLLDRMVRSARDRGQNHTARRFEEDRDGTREALETLRALQQQIGGAPTAS
ncbi:chemotaxis protein CheB [Nonomuraea soli]|uniref:protein-glutamate methylesterase n=1 Tax=Nonomuraea soli TaxID=1032476 RepID=A0A7W0CEY1_9ACTN|nr:chemotaxis protein CheB [Nonomuraea soli]MBA2889861.1 two-component system chemotaxis response regulator CheB [Nonomuraea soli]